MGCPTIKEREKTNPEKSDVLRYNGMEIIETQWKGNRLKIEGAENGKI